MRPSFAETKNIVLKALYSLAHEEDNQEYFTQIEIKEKCDLDLSGVMISRAANALCVDKLFDWGRDPEDDSGTQKFQIADEGILAAENLVYSDEISLEEIPAAGRVVTLSHNQIVKIGDGASEILDLVEEEYTPSNEPGVMELILGQLKAGRELVRSAVFEARLFWLTMVVGLRMLKDKYKNHFFLFKYK